MSLSQAGRRPCVDREPTGAFRTSCLSFPSLLDCRMMERSRTAQQPIGVSIGHLLMLLVTLAGLFAMHGLSDHGTAGPGEMAMVESGHTGHAEMTGGDTAAQPARDGMGSSQQSPHHDMGLLGLCLAIGVAVFALAIALLLLQVVRVRALLPAQLSSLLGSVSSRVPRPPNLFALSIQRC